jgi:hypothetical protein
MRLFLLSPPPPWWAQLGYPWTWGCTWWQKLWIVGTDTFHSGRKIQNIICTGNLQIIFKLILTNYTTVTRIRWWLCQITRKQSLFTRCNSTTYPFSIRNIDVNNDSTAKEFVDTKTRKMYVHIHLIWNKTSIQCNSKAPHFLLLKRRFAITNCVKWPKETHFCPSCKFLLPVTVHTVHTFLVTFVCMVSFKKLLAKQMYCWTILI